MAIGEPPKPNTTGPGKDRERNEKLDLSILYAEDEEALREMMGELLEMRYSHVEIVKDGQELMEKLSAPGAEYDCVFTDNNMPIMDGLEVLQRIRSGPNLKNIPFVILSGVAFDTDRNQDIKGDVEKAGGIFLQKPVLKDKLYTEIEKAVKIK